MEIYALLPLVFLVMVGVPVVAYFLGRFDNRKARNGRD